MIIRTLLSASLIFAAASAAQAQAIGGAQPAQQQSQPLGGPVIAGVCLLSREAIFANAAVGRAASARLQELTQAAQAEIDQERAPLETEAHTLEGQPENAQTQQRRQQVAQRWQTLQQKAAHNSREIEATRTSAMNRIAAEAQPVIAQVYGQKNCGLLFDRNSALGGNFANDLTPDVVRGLDARIQTITFERESLAQQPSAQVAPGNH
nr:OmpH family outer membrane protein [uncultured Brevundimonas sp.]